MVGWMAGGKERTPRGENRETLRRETRKEKKQRNYAYECKIVAKMGIKLKLGKKRREGKRRNFQNRFSL